jgi:hypothetical protein
MTYRCVKKNCRKERSIFLNTFFEESKLPLNKIFYVLNAILYDMPIKSIITTNGIYSESVCSITSYIRQLVRDNVEMESVKIGGEGIEVEVDETKMGKRKYHKGHRVGGVWVVAGVERTPERKIFVQEVENRDEATIQSILNTFVKPGSIVLTDCWKAYKPACEALGLEHKTVNHSQYYVNPEDGTHTNTIEGNNNALNIVIKPQHCVKKKVITFMVLYLEKTKQR